MNPVAADSWLEANHHYLNLALTELRYALERHAGHPEGGDSRGPERPVLGEKTADMPAPPALETLCALFGLSPFERDVLLLCAGAELDAAFPVLCAQGDPKRTYPTFGLALAALRKPHWSALSPAAPLRSWRLVEVGSEYGLTRSLLRIDERVLHYLTGVQYLDDRLRGLIEPVPADELLPSHHALAGRLARRWSQEASAPHRPVVQLSGGDQEGRRAIAAAACEALGLKLHALSTKDLPLDPRELEALMRLWEREAALSSSALLLEYDEPATNDPAREHAVLRLLGGTNGAIVVAEHERNLTLRRPSLTLEVPRPTTSEQRTLWWSALDEVATDANGQVEAIVTQFDLSVGDIRSASAEVLDRNGNALEEDLGSLMWEASRTRARPRLEALAQRIEPTATWDDLVLPEAQQMLLQEMATHVRQRSKVYEGWGFAAKSSGSLGISALFAGPSGTGKTMAAEVLANELRLDLYRIDLSSVVSKYIGETEKNLRRVFDAAEGGGGILLFDEADALFGKRSEVRDSHDRYANIEVSYLLQRMEAYRGLAILTTNMKGALDQAFLRRIRFAVLFPFPNAEQRAEIWQRIFPFETPTEDLNIDKLARLNVAGGNIRNIALNAAFLAADAGESVRMKHLLRAVLTEYAKLEKPLTEAEIGGWV